ncbi:MAG: DNA methyltransferase [Nitrososphaerota archaeon]
MAEEFRSRLEEIMPAEELLFDPTPAFGKYKPLMPEESVTHPAKFNTNLVEFLIKTYTKPGDVVLDCMAGTGVLGVIAALHGRHAIQVEIEPKFFSWMEKARENVEKFNTLITKGRIINICGDARKLSELLTEKADIAITSPPYSNISKPGNIKIPISKEEFEKLKEKGVHSVYHDVRPERKGTLYEYYKMIPIERYGSSDNIDRLPYGNIDVIITSPPYEGSLEGTTRHTRGGIASRDPALAQTGTYATVLSEATKKGVPIYYSPSKDNIGNLKSSDEEYEMLAKRLMKDGKPTYLSEMLKVYGEMWKVLKRGGLAIIVIKPFVRNKKVIDLPYHTFQLLSMVGFSLEKLYKLRLKQQSFWRILYRKKYPEVPQINHEYVLVCRKKTQ